jgi:UDP-glucose 4-epimerase
MNRILVTGGLGYIGSHTVVELLHEGFEVVIIDNLSNASAGMLKNMEQITGSAPVFYELEMCDETALAEMFKKESPFEVVIHFAAFKAVGESVKLPLKYFKNNLVSLMNLLDVMQSFSCGNIVFSSSATVYGDPLELPVKETTPGRKALSAYGSTKQMGEEIIEKVTDTGKLNAISLRYFNPVGAHESGLIGELPSGMPNNLMPFITQTAIGKQRQLTVYGNDYPTKDGSCLRDYIHVVDLAKAHVNSCRRLINNEAKTDYEVFNIGTGNGFSVLELIHAFEKENKVQVNYVIGERRPGDTPEIYADVQRANSLLNWKSEKGIADMVIDSWRWEKNISKDQTK